MKHSIKPLIITLLATASMLIFTGCSGSGEDKYIIERLTVMSGTENPENIWKVSWPEQYSCNNENITLENCKEMTDEQKEFIYSFVSSLPEHVYEEAPDGTTTEKVYLCRIELRTASGGALNIHGGLSPRFIYDSYPEGYDRFVSIFNEICGGDKEYLTNSDKIIEVTPEIYGARLGITDTNVRGGTVAELQEHTNITNIVRLNYLRVLDARDCAKDFYFVKYLPFEVRSVPSSDEECMEYARNLAEKFGIDASKVVHEESECGEQDWYLIPDYKGYSLRVYRTELIRDKIVTSGGFMNTYYGSYTIFENLASPYEELSASASYDFTYSPDFKFAIALVGNFPDVTMFEEIGEAVYSD